MRELTGTTSSSIIVNFGWSEEVIDSPLYGSPLVTELISVAPYSSFMDPALKEIAKPVMAENSKAPAFDNALSRSYRCSSAKILLMK